MAVPRMIDRLIEAGEKSRLRGWLGPLAVTLFGGFLRFWHLDRPHAIVFDETYYVKDANALTRFGVEVVAKASLSKDEGKRWGAADPFWLKGDTNVFDSTRPEFVVHPPLGKWIMSIGQDLFGATSSFGWRFSVALLGTLSILMMGRIATRLFRSALLGTTAALLLALDGMHFVLSRTSILDIIVMFWALAAFGCLLIDRDRARERLATAFEPARAGIGNRGRLRLGRLGPGIGIRWWRIAAGVCLGCCTATKWSGLYFVAAFGLLTLCWDIAARRRTGHGWWLATALGRDGTAAAAQLLPAAALTYLASWSGWLHSTQGYDRNWAAGHPATGWQTHLPDALRSLAAYHKEMWTSALAITSKHDYMSNPWSWLVQGRVTSFYYTGWAPGNHACPYSNCSRAVTALGNPVLWWSGTVAIAVVVAMWLLGRDWRAGAILAGLAAGYLPWFLYQQRTVFTFYTVAFVPYLVLALSYALGLLIGPRDASPNRRLYGGVAAGCVVLLVLMAFGWWYPVWSAQRISYGAWSDRMWLPTWI
jgi:dolichyl-phosphate-mannose-protein mannosyltransferase